MKIHLLLSRSTLALALSLGACSKPRESTQQAELPVITVRAQTVEAKPHVAVEEVTGTIRAKLHSVIEAKMVGRVEKLLVVPGQPMKAGDVLVQLDSREIEAKLDQARAVMEQSNKELQRYTSLLASKVTTQAEFDGVQSRNRVTKAAVAEAETNLSYATIKAPFSGVITRKLADVGDLAAPGKAILEMENPAALRFEADVPEAVIGKIEAGATLPVQTGTMQIPATVSEIAPGADANSRTFLVKLDLPPTVGVRTGQFGRVGVPVSETSVLRIPASAVIQRGQMEMVFVIEKGRAQLRLVKTGKRLGNEIEVVSGIESKEQVATENVAQLADGQRVEVQSK